MSMKWSCEKCFEKGGISGGLGCFHNQPIEEKWKIRFRCEFTTTGEGFGDRKWYGYPSPDQIESFIENLLEQERKRMSDEVEKAKIGGTQDWKGAFNDGLDTAKRIINK